MSLQAAPEPPRLLLASPKQGQKLTRCCAGSLLLFRTLWAAVETIQSHVRLHRDAGSRSRRCWSNPWGRTAPEQRLTEPGGEGWRENNRDLHHQPGAMGVGNTDRQTLPASSSQSGWGLGFKSVSDPSIQGLVQDAAAQYGAWGGIPVPSSFPVSRQGVSLP